VCVCVCVRVGAHFTLNAVLRTWCFKLVGRRFRTANCYRGVLRTFSCLCRYPWYSRVLTFVCNWYRENCHEHGNPNACLAPRTYKVPEVRMWVTCMRVYFLIEYRQLQAAYKIHLVTEWGCHSINHESCQPDWMTDSLAELRVVCMIARQWQDQTYHPHGLIPILGNQ